MATSFKLRNFSNPAILKAIAKPLLTQFLQRYDVFFAGRQLSLAPQQEIDYERLASILMSPGEDTPPELLDALFFIDEMSLPQCYDDLLNKLPSIEIPASSLSEPTTADLAVLIWLKSPGTLETMHAEQFMVHAKKYDLFLPTIPVIPPMVELTETVINAIEHDLNEWFETQKRGRGTKVFVFRRDGLVWFLIRHGEPYKRQGTLKNAESSSIFFRPEKFDVLVYDPQLAEFSIHTDTKGEKKAYCKFVGKHLFGSGALFNVDNCGDKYTLEPLRTEGPDSLVCTDVEGIESVRLSEVQFRHDSSASHLEIHRSGNVFEALDAQGRCIPEDVRLIRASFKVLFTNADRPRTVSVRPPNSAIFDRESDREVVSEWLTLRGFSTVHKEVKNGEAKPVLEVV